LTDVTHAFRFRKKTLSTELWRNKKICNDGVATVTNYMDPSHGGVTNRWNRFIKSKMY